MTLPGKFLEWDYEDRSSDSKHSQTARATQLLPTFRWPSSILCRIPTSQSGFSELPLVQVNSFCRFPYHGVDVFAHIIISTSRRLAM